MSKKIVIFIPPLIGFLLSIFFIWHFGFEKLEFGDYQDYINGANAFLNGTPYPLRSEFHPMFRPPLFPYLIAVVWLIFPKSIIAIKITQALLHAGTVFIVGKIAYELTSKKFAALLAGLVCAANPLLLAHTVDFYTEPLHAFLCALAFLLLVKMLKADKFLYFQAFYSGVVFGLATLCRPAILGVALVLYFIFAILHLRDVQRLKYLVATGILVASTFLAILPWTYHNYRQTGEFILVNDGFSYNLWLGNLPKTIQLYEGGFKDKEENQKFSNYIWGAAVSTKLEELNASDNFDALKINEREKVWRREALKNMSADYGLTGRLFFGKLWSFWTPFLNYLTYGWKIVAVVATFVIFTFVFGLFGLRIVARDSVGKKFAILLLASFAVTTAIHVLIFGFVRYRVPNVDPYLSMLAGIAVWHLALKMFPRLNSIQS